MSSLLDMIGAFIAMLLSAAFLHFGAAGDSRPTTPIAEVSHSTAASVPAGDPVIDTESDAKASPAALAHVHARHLAAHSHCHGSAGAMPALDAVRTPSPLRRS